MSRDQSNKVGKFDCPVEPTCKFNQPVSKSFQSGFGLSPG
jgi:hypothetical protein